MPAIYNIPGNINASGGELQNVKLQSLISTPQDATESRFWYDSVNHRPMYHNGTSATPFGNNYSGGTGITISGNEISVTNYNNLITTSQKGVANGVASLDNNGLVPTSQLPSYVDDVIETYIVSGSTAFSAGWLSLTDGGTALTPETGKIYVILSSGSYQNKTYRWSGSTYIDISASPGQATTSTPGIAKIADSSYDSSNNTDIITPSLLTGYTERIRVINAFNPPLQLESWGIIWTIPIPNRYNVINATLRNIHTQEIIFAPYGFSSGASGGVQFEMLANADIPQNTFYASILCVDDPLPEDENNG